MTALSAPEDVRAIPVGELFSSRADRYSIPLYQRNYTWGEEQIHRLVHDVLDSAEHDASQDYFLGNLVVAPPAHAGDPFDVIDGQQRLTTLYILLSKLGSLQREQSTFGGLQPLVYESREKATRALRGVADGTSDEDDLGSEREDSGIIQAKKILDQLLDDTETGARLLRPRVLDYLLTRVLIIRMPIDRSTDLNRYFEIMNTRGAQLSPVDIVKARLLRNLSDPRDRALLNHVWTACSDMAHYVTMTATPGDTAWRATVFGSDWDALPSQDFHQLRAQLIDSRSPWERSPGLPESGDEPTAMTIDQALVAYAKTKLVTEVSEQDAGDRFTSQITFPTLLLHVLAVRRTGVGEDLGERDRQLDDKLLVERFSEPLRDLDAEERADWVRRFTTDLLRVRCLFDRYILKRDATLTTGHESTSDEEPGSWSLYTLERSDGAGKRRDAPVYRTTFGGDESEAASGSGSWQRRILLLQSALRVTYTSPRTMHWITDALRYLTELADRGEPITAEGLHGRLNTFALRRLDAALHPSGGSAGTAQLDPNGHPLGFAIPRIVFTYLDYLLVEQEKRWDFTFSYRTSIEHFSPQTEDSEHISEPYRVHDRALLDWLGNLALVTVSANSKLATTCLHRRPATRPRAGRASSSISWLASRSVEAGMTTTSGCTTPRWSPSCTRRSSAAAGEPGSALRLSACVRVPTPPACAQRAAPGCGRSPR